MERWSVEALLEVTVCSNNFNNNYFKIFQHNNIGKILVLHIKVVIYVSGNIYKQFHFYCDNMILLVFTTVLFVSEVENNCFDTDYKRSKYNSIHISINISSNKFFLPNKAVEVLRICS